MRELEILNVMLDKYDFNDDERGLLENIRVMLEDGIREYGDMEEEYKYDEDSEEE